MASLLTLFQVPFMIAGIAVNSVGAGLLTTIGITTSTMSWATFMVINGFGIGMAMQMPYTALQACLEFVTHISSSFPEHGTHCTA
jgi:hypothetical protein